MNQFSSKKRFLWTFKIDGVVNTIELVASFVSGKRKVLHNDREIYTEKELLNVNFEFAHKIDNHMFRLSQDKNKFNMVVDGCTFEDWLRNRGFRRQEERKKPINWNVEDKGQNDPFAEFGAVTKKSSNKNHDHNAFGEFEDFGFSSNPNSGQSKFGMPPTVHPSSQSFEE